MCSKHLSKILVVFSTATFAFNALAQQESSAQEQTAVLEEIIVTAEKRSENLQKVPVSVTAFTSAARDELGIANVQDLTKYTPGMGYSTSLDRLTLRGVGRFTNNLAADSGVAIYTDNFYTISTISAATAPLFIERTEILRGPQGTLYGRNSIGGAINVITVRPTDELSGEARVIYGDYDRREMHGLIRGPLTENINYLLGGSLIEQDEGYFKNVNGGPSEGGVQDDDYILFELEGVYDNFDVLFKYEVNNWDRRRRTLVRAAPYDTDFGLNALGAATALVPTGTLAPSALYNTGQFSFGGNTFNLIPAAQQYTATNPGVTDNRKFRTNTPFEVTLDDDETFLIDFSYYLGDVKIRYTGGYHSYLFNQMNDFDGTDREFYDYTDPVAFNTTRVFTSSVFSYTEDREFSSHEINVSSNSDSEFQWLVGFYNYHEEYSQPISVFNPDQTIFASPCITLNFVTCAGIPTDPNPTQALFFTNTDMDGNDSNAVYGQIDWAFADNWSTTIGLRYTKDKKDLVESTRLIRWDPTFNANAPVLDITRLITANNDVSRRLKDDWDAVTGTLGFEWAPTNKDLAYAKYSRGYKAGGFNSGTISSGAVNVDEESIDALEFGWKTTISDNLQINSSLFYYDYQDFQSVIATLPPAGGAISSDFLNLEKATSLGFEVESIWAPTDALKILFNYSWQKSEIKEAGNLALNLSDPTAVDRNANPAQTLTTRDALTGDFQVLQDLSGNPLPGSPENKIALNVRYSMDFRPGRLTFSVSDTWRDETNYDIFNDAGSIADSFNQVDMRVLWTNAEETYTIIGFVQNVFDDEGFDGITSTRDDSGSIFIDSSLTNPRVWGLELQARFGN